MTEFLRARAEHWREVAREWGGHPTAATPIADGFVVAERGTNSLWCVFEDDTRSGYLYAFDAETRTIVESVQVYLRDELLDVHPENVRVYWSTDKRKCAVAVWSHLRAIIDLGAQKVGGASFHDQNSPGINDNEWLRGFEYLYEEN